MKTAAELWADTIKKQPIDDLTIKHTCESLEELINKKKRRASASLASSRGPRLLFSVSARK